MLEMHLISAKRRGRHGAGQRARSEEIAKRSPNMEKQVRL